MLIKSLHNQYLIHSLFRNKHQSQSVSLLFLSDLFLSFLDHKSSFSHNVINTALKFQAKSGDFVDLKCNLSQQISTYDASQQNILQLHTNKNYFS